MTKQIDYQLNKDVELLRLEFIKSYEDGFEINRFLDLGIELKSNLTDQQILEELEAAGLKGKYIIGRSPCVCIKRRKGELRRVLLRKPRNDFEQFKAMSPQSLQYLFEEVEAEHKQNEFAEFVNSTVDNQSAIEFIENNDLQILQAIGIA